MIRMGKSIHHIWVSIETIVLLPCNLNSKAYFCHDVNQAYLFNVVKMDFDVVIMLFRVMFSEISSFLSAYYKPRKIKFDSENSFFVSFQELFLCYNIIQGAIVQSIVSLTTL